MAIKGKKKSQKRGQPRRPSAPPRPLLQPKQRPRWYRTPLGLTLTTLVAIVVVGLVIYAIQNAGSNARALQRRQDGIDKYTGEVRALLQKIRAPVGAMAAAPPTLADQEQAEQLEKAASDWARSLQEAQATFAAAPPGDALTSANTLYIQALAGYVNVAQTYELAAREMEPGPGAKGQQELLSLATQQRTTASTLWTEATVILDRQRTAADLELSGLRAPDPGAQPPAPGAPGLPPGLPGDLAPPGEAPEGGGAEGGTGGGGGKSGGKKENGGRGGGQ
ncbi:MAG: hypothetical protein M3280_04265 [Actinomycetota bacterium]|nr:hypothetical protein [Actinomycetota bacterium]